MHTLRREGAVPSLATDLPGRVFPPFPILEMQAPCSGEPKQPGGSAPSPGTVSRCLPAGLLRAPGH